MIDDEPGPLTIGSSFLDKYEVQAMIGRGGHAWVYHGVDRFMGRHVAIKIVHRSAGSSQDTLRRARAEAQFLSRFKHPNVVEVLDGGLTKDGQLYIVMELLQGRSLYDVIKQDGRLQLGEVLFVFEQIAEAIHAAHEAGAIHRDLKPGNVFVIKDNRVKVLDFGIAKLEDAGWTTQRDLVLGTVFYMSPEQLQGTSDLTARSDIYSLGAMLYEALTGVHYVKRRAAEKNVVLHNIAAVIPIVVADEITPLHELDAEIPGHIGRLVDRCMAKAPDQRFETMRAVAEALRASHERLASEQQAARRLLQYRDLSRREHAPGPSTTVASPVSAKATSSDTEPVLQARFLGGTRPPSQSAPIDPSAAVTVGVPPGQALAPMGTVRQYPQPGAETRWGYGAPSQLASVSPAAAGLPTPVDATREQPPPRARGIGRAVIVAAISGPLVFGGLTFLYLQASRDGQAPAAPASGVVVESVVESPPLKSATPLSAGQAPSTPIAAAPALPSASASAATIAPAAAPLPVKTPRATTPTRATPAAQHPAPSTAPATPAPAPRVRDKIDERLEMLEEDFRREKGGAK